MRWSVREFSLACSKKKLDRVSDHVVSLVHSFEFASLEA